MSAQSLSPPAQLPRGATPSWWDNVRAVRITRIRPRYLLTLGTVIAGMLLAWHPCVFALDPTLDVNQYAHTSWKTRDGYFKGVIESIAQTPDGVLWLGTDFGLVRFDGVRAVPWQPPSGEQLPSSYIAGLLVSHDGTLWVGTSKGLASWRDGKLTVYRELSGLMVIALVQDHEGTVWAGGFAYTPPGKLCAIENDRIHCYGQDGTFGNGVLGLYEDSKGALYAGVLNGFWRWKPGRSRFYPLGGEPYGIQQFAEHHDGTLLIPAGGKVVRLADGKIRDAYQYPEPTRQAHGTRILRDRDGGLWIGTLTEGLVHVHQGSTDTFTQVDGLSGDTVAAFFQDREGTIWVATSKGLDRLRAYSVATLSERQGLSSGANASAVAALDGTIWFSARARLSRWENGQVTVYQETGTGSAPISADSNGRVRVVTVPGMPKHDLASLFQDSAGRIWVAANGGVGYLQEDRFVSIDGVPGGVVDAIAGDLQDNLWISILDRGLFHLHGDKLVQHIPWAALGRNDLATALAIDPSRGGVWLGFSKGGLVYFDGSHILASYTTATGLGDGRVSDLRFDNHGALWAATDSGLSHLKDGRIATLTTKNGLPCDSIYWSVEDKNQLLWLYGSCGLIRIGSPDLESWVATSESTTPKSIQASLFDSSDGVSLLPSLSGAPGPRASISPDGKIWFPTLDGLSVIDPRHLPLNSLPPPVHVEQIIADHKAYDATPDSNGRVPLPARIRDLQMDYTALSLVAPEKVLFRYKLEGWDRDWQDAGTRRQAFYSNLPPRKYTFRVKACNNSGVWNEAGTSLTFSIAPAYYQTWWFRSLCVIAFLGLLLTLYRLRLRQLSRQFNIRLEARVAERTRIARELHDTLLQNFQGVLLKFHALTYTLVDRPAEAQKTLKNVIEQARQAITEGRDAVHGLRAPGLVGNDIAQALSVLARDLANDQNGMPCPDFHVQVEGTPRDLSPLLRDDIYRIACEALRNAFRHAHARRIEVEIRYDQRQLRLRVRDDGKGIDPKVLDAGGRVGHYGFPGMHERAKLVGGKLAIWSEIDSGTEAELTIPASVVYAKPKSVRHPTFGAKGA